MCHPETDYDSMFPRALRPGGEAERYTDGEGAVVS
jgi:hypothetical protein